MKRKNLVLAAIAFIFAVGGAFASIFVAQTAYAEVLDSSTDTTWECKQVGSCSNAGEIDCRINVPVQVSPGSKTITAEQPGCTQVLKHDSFDIMQGEVEFYDVR